MFYILEKKPVFATFDELYDTLKRIPEEEQYSTHVNESRIYLSENEKDFTPLKENLEPWINAKIKEITDNF